MILALGENAKDAHFNYFCTDKAVSKEQKDTPCGYNIAKAFVKSNEFLRTKLYPSS